MPDDENDQPTDGDPSFDAVKAAAEFAAAMEREAPQPSDDATPGGGEDKYTAILEEEVESLRALLARREEELDAAKRKAEAAAAEVERVRARTERSATASIEQARRKVIASFLDVADGLDRAVAELSGADVAEAAAQGVELVRSELRSVLSRHGATHRPAKGEAFDSAHHDAIATVPATDEAPEGTITAVLSEGYEIDGQPLRAARVVVAKG